MKAIVERLAVAVIITAPNFTAIPAAGIAGSDRALII